VLRGAILHIRRVVPLPELDSIPPLDAIVISHAHHDHLDPASLRQLGADCPVIGPRGIAGIVRKAGYGRSVEVEAGGRVEVGGVTVEAVPAVHEGRRYPFGRRRAALGFLVQGSSSLYFAGDTDLMPEMAHLRDRADVAALPVSGWGPRVGAGHLDPERAARAAALIQPRIAIPIHWGTYVAMGAQRGGDRLAPARQFADAARRLAPKVEVRILAPGERMDL
jgi:L-ascorbate metabolism protein UlaG (beta-lactamase superfamily)